MKTESEVVEGIYSACTNKNYVVMYVAPYENQVRLIFGRLAELIDGSPLVKKRVTRSTKSPFVIEFANGSKIVGFTTGASSNSGGASLRGQRADVIFVDEMDYLGDGDFENITMLAAERAEIRIIVSSTPTGRRGAFYNICTAPKSEYKEHYHPSMHNPNWNDAMEAEFRSELTELGYAHEVLADFGPQDTGVFNKNKIDEARLMDNYAYEELTAIQKTMIEREGKEPPIMYLPNGGRFKPNLFRTMGVNILLRFYSDRKYQLDIKNLGSAHNS